MFAIKLSFYVGLSIITLTFAQINEFEKCLEHGGFLLAATICQDSNYRKTIIPSKPLTVKVISTLQDVRDLDEVDLSMSTRMEWTLEWNDKNLIANTNNLSEDPIPMDTSGLDRIWSPDLHIDELVKFEGS
jgi:hypothetical protein